MSGFSTIKNKLVSSANKRMLQPISLTISLIKSKKSKGQRIEPWETPARISFQFDPNQVRLLSVSY